MILQSLNRYYDILLDDPDTKIAAFGYSAVGISFALDISREGELLNVLPLFDQVQRGKKMVEVPRTMIVPAQVKRSVGIVPNFLWDNTVYVLGISERDEEKPEYSQDRFKAFCQWNSDLLADVDNDMARAVIAFLQKHDPQTAREHPAIAGHLETLLKGGNLVFLFNGNFVHKNNLIRRVWENSLTGQGAARMQCLVTGEIAPIARLHPSLKRVRGAQAVGASLVSFNERAYDLIFAQTERISIQFNIIHANRGRFYSKFERKRLEQYLSKQIRSSSAYGCGASNSIRLSCPARK